jgi:hypothetical protein
MRKDIEYKRVNNVIQADKTVMSEACKTLILQDLADKCGEYFEMASLPKMSIACIHGKYVVEVAFEAERIKKFNVLK